MRYQQPIFENSGFDRNTDMYIVNMSSDLCIYEEPNYTVSGGCKITTGITTADTCVHILTNFYDNINLNFSLTGGTTATTFSFDIHRYNSDLSAFSETVVYHENSIPYSASHDTNIVGGSLQLDGEYLIKGFYIDPVCTDILGRLGLTINTRDYSSEGRLYGLYTPETDYYFIAFLEATTPNILNQTYDSTDHLATLTISPTFNGQTEIVFNDIYIGEIIVNLNGLTMSKDNDYTIINGLITFVSELKISDVVTIAGIINGNGYTLLNSYSFEVTGITSGVTSGQGTNNVYYNTDINKYEVFTPNPIQGITLLNVNGVTLSSYYDYTASTTSNNGIILNDYLVIDDVITIIYQSPSAPVNIAIEPDPYISWSLVLSPGNDLGWFEFEVSDTSDFSNIIYSATQNYVVGTLIYGDTIPTSGYTLGDVLYYRVTNNKVYRTIMGDDLITSKITNIYPITLMY